MTWVAWRLQRTEMVIAAGILAALTLILLPSGLEMAHAYNRDGLSSCLAHPTDACGQTVDAFVARFHSTGSLVAWMTLLPGLIGVLLATPFLLDLENGTYGSRGRRASRAAAGSPASSHSRSARP
jgi:hypothetical protein